MKEAYKQTGRLLHLDLLVSHVAPVRPVLQVHLPFARLHVPPFLQGLF